MMGLSKRWHLWRRKRAQIKRRRALNRQVNRNLLQGVTASKRSGPLFTPEQAAALGVTGAEMGATLKTNAGMVAAVGMSAATIRAAEILVEQAKGYGRQLGLSDEAAASIIDEHLARARTTAHPIEWAAVRRAMIDRSLNEGA